MSPRMSSSSRGPDDRSSLYRADSPHDDSAGQVYERIAVGYCMRDAERVRRLRESNVLDEFRRVIGCIPDLMVPVL